MYFVYRFSQTTEKFHVVGGFSQRDDADAECVAFKEAGAIACVRESSFDGMLDREIESRFGALFGAAVEKALAEALPKALAAHFGPVNAAPVASAILADGGSGPSQAMAFVGDGPSKSAFYMDGEGNIYLDTRYAGSIVADSIMPATISEPLVPVSGDGLTVFAADGTKIVDAAIKLWPSDAPR